MNKSISKILFNKNTIIILKNYTYYKIQFKIQLNSTILITLFSYSTLLSVYSLAASLFAGELGLGSHNKL